MPALNPAMVEDLTRNAADVLPAGGLEEKLKLGRPLRVKLGIDVTAPDVTLGNGIPLQRMRAFQDAGHLGVHRVAHRPVVRDGEVVVRPVGNVSVTFDHRVVDGARAAEFALAVIARLQGG